MAGYAHVVSVCVDHKQHMHAHWKQKGESEKLYIKAFLAFYFHHLFDGVNTKKIFFLLRKSVFKGMALLSYLKCSLDISVVCISTGPSFTLNEYKKNHKCKGK